MSNSPSVVPDRPDLDAFVADFEAFYARFADRLARAEARRQPA